MQLILLNFEAKLMYLIIMICTSLYYKNILFIALNKESLLNVYGLTYKFLLVKNNLFINY